MRIELACDGCGGNSFVFPQGELDEAVVECGECGRSVGTMGALKDLVAEAVVKQNHVSEGSEINHGE